MAGDSDKKDKLGCLVPVLAVLEVPIAIAVTLHAGVPNTLPNIALGSTFLFHIERVCAIILILTLIATVVLATLNRRLPDNFSAGGAGFGYTKADEKLLDKATSGVAVLETFAKNADKRIEALETQNDALGSAVGELKELVETLDARTKSRTQHFPQN